MATFYARYPATSGSTSGTSTIVEGKGTAGTPVGGVLTVQGDPAGTPIPVTATFSGALNIAGKTYSDSVRKDYSSGSVTTGAWVQLIASTAAACTALSLFDSSGQTLELGTGAPASETRKLIIPPGGIDGWTPLAIPAATRLSVRAISGTASVGELDITLLN